MRPPKNNSTLR